MQVGRVFDALVGVGPRAQLAACCQSMYDWARQRRAYCASFAIDNRHVNEWVESWGSRRLVLETVWTTRGAGENASDSIWSGRRSTRSSHSLLTNVSRMRTGESI